MRDTSQVDRYRSQDAAKPIVWQGDTWAKRLAAFIREHGLPATIVPEGIQTLDRYVDCNTGQLHEDPVTLPLCISYIKEWLGY